MKSKKIEDANYVKWLLTDQIYDLTAPIVIARELLSNPNLELTHTLIAKLRMCHHALIIALFKLHEISKVYPLLIRDLPVELGKSFKEIVGKIEKVGVCRFRNKYAAHIIDKDTKRPVSLAKGTEILGGIIGCSVAEHLEFYNWIIPEREDSTLADSVLKTIVAVRDHCSQLAGGDAERP